LSSILNIEGKGMSSSIVLINPFIVPEGKLEESIKYWESHRDFLKTQPGYISTKLHRSLETQSFLGEAKYKLINVAEWESQDAFNSAVQKMQLALNTERVEGLVGQPALYEVVRE
tara:strand:+ start:351 stop:695 length:345 start_codon:yes stop_codon:yes gene_type:complete